MRKRNIQVMTHLNNKEYQMLMKKVRKSGMSRESFIRHLMTGCIPREAPSPDYHAMMRELNAIGTILNQIAARANATGFFLADEYEMRYRQLMEKVMAIQAAVTLPEKL